MSSVTFDVAVGGDGSTVTDDNNATTGLREGGWKTRFVPCFTQQVAVANYVVTKAGEASSSASAASSSASAASSSASAAAASYDSFDDRYLGAKTSDPTLDNDGNALLTGALYWNTASSVMKVWSGTVWVAYNPAISYLPTAGGTMTGAITFSAGQFATGVNTFLTTPSSANLAAALTDETGTGVNVFNNTPTLITPILGTPTSGNLSNCTNAIGYGLKSGTTTVSVSGATAPTSGQALIATSPTDATWQNLPSSIASVVRNTKTSTYTLVAGDKGTLVEVTSGTFTLSLTAAATLGSGWWCYVSNIGTGLITIDPDSSETITVNGESLTTWVQWTNEIGLLQCDGTGFHYYQIQKGYIKQIVSSAVASITFSSGIAKRKLLKLTYDNVTPSATADGRFYVNGAGDNTGGTGYYPNTIRGYYAGSALTGVTANSDALTLGGYQKVSATDADRASGKMDISITSSGITADIDCNYTTTSSINTSGHASMYWSINSYTTLTDFTFFFRNVNISTGTVTLWDV